MTGLEPVLAEELKNLGAKKIQPGIRSVTFTGDKALLYKANLYLRTALRVLKPFNSFKVSNEDQLYKNAGKTDWSFIKSDQTIAVESTVNSSFFRHSKYVALLLKDAIVDQIRNKTGKRPDVDIANPDYRIHIHINDDMAELSLDSSGESLHRRGYRARQSAAPLNEVLAAGLLALAGWKGTGIFTDPMCGSGTIPIEAALIAKNIPPGFIRNEFGFMNWDDFDPGLWGKILADAEKNFISKPDAQIYGSDFSGKYIDIARENSRIAGTSDIITFETADFRKFTPPVPENNALTVINPPYGERLSLPDVKDFYKNIGDRLKEVYTNYDVWIISSNKDAMKSVGLRTSRKLTLKNGPLEVKYHKYEMYRGSKKEKAG